MSNYNIYSTSLTHHGIKGQKWGVRRFQNKDGSLTDAGKKRESKFSDRVKSTGASVKKAISDKKAKNIEYRKKMKAISKNENYDGRTRTQALYASRSPIGKLANDVGVATATVAIGNILTGRNALTTKDGAEIAARTLAISAGNHVYAKNLSKHYDKDGHRTDMNYISESFEGAFKTSTAATATYVGAKIVSQMFRSNTN